MASIPRRLLLQSRQCPARTRGPVLLCPRPQWQRTLFTTAPQREENTATTTTPQSPRSKRKPMSQAEKESAMLSSLHSDLTQLDPEMVADAIRKGKRGIPFATDFNLENDEDFDIEEDDRRKVMAGFWAEGEPELGADEDYYGDDITSHGHGELEKQRDIREYARLIAWELPLLSQLARPFVPPTESTPFRFRYTSYLGESHPASNKVVVEFSPQDLTSSATPESLRLTPAQATKLMKIAGPRYNPTTQILKLSCERFDTLAQNKRDLGQTIDRLIKEAQAGADSFADVPLDVRHVREKRRAEFPKEWALTPERKRYLEETRMQRARIEDERSGNGLLVDGQRVIETNLPPIVEEVAEPVPVRGARR